MMNPLALAMIAAAALLAQAEEQGMTLLQQIHSGGITGYIIILLSLVAMTIVIIHLIAVRPDRLVPPNLVSQIGEALARRDVDAALQICRRPEHDCFFTRVLAQGLTRYQRSAFGPFEFKDALEEAGTEQVARLYRATDALGLIGSIAPMLGLLGTVIGMVGAFGTISAAGTRPELLAGDISKALITTLMGLSVAIPTMAVFTYLRNRIDAYAARAAQVIEEITVPLEPTGGGAARPAALGVREQGPAVRVGGSTPEPRTANPEPRLPRPISPGPMTTPARPAAPAAAPRAQA